MSDALVPGPAETPKGKRSKVPPAATAKRKSKPQQSAKPTDLLPPAAETMEPAEQRWRMIAEEAYLRAERRGFANGDPVDDWLAAEREVDERLGRP